MSRPRATLIALLLAPVTLVAMALLPAGAAQAQVVPARAGTTTHSGAPPSHASRAVPKRHVAPAKSTGLKAKPAKGAAKDARRVCAGPKKGRASCLALIRTNVRGHKGTMAADQEPPGYGPSDLQSAYDLPSATAGSGETVAVVDAYNDPDAEADLQTYRAQYGLPVCDTANGCFQQVNQQGQASPLPQDAGDTGWDVEESLDVDMVSAACPNCHILLVEANSTSLSDLGAAVNAAVALGAKYVSNSYGTFDYDVGPSETQYDQYYKHPGVAVTAAAGDDGYTPGNGPEYPATSQYVTAVGGTTLTQAPTTSRGWTETAWSGTDSGCALYEPKPTWQTDTGCTNRTDNDVSAVADPNTGVAFYDSYGGEYGAGWGVVGGTSVASPIIASAYALAGTPAGATYPSSYPYADPSALNDITTGSNGSCSLSYLCTAGPGYDGPTGLGTPDGVAAFTVPSSYGTVTGTVTSAKTGQPVSGATVAFGNYSVTTGGNGQYSIGVPSGSYTVTVSDYGFVTKAITGHQVPTGSSTLNVKLAAAPDVTLSGVVTDGSGHGYPLYAKVSISGYPAGAVYTNPYTGAYSVTLPGHASYTLQVAPADMNGYVTKTLTVHLDSEAVTRNVNLAIDQAACTAPGYTLKTTGITEGFTGWTGTTPQDGWTVAQGQYPMWQFGSSNSSPSQEPPGSDGQWAEVNDTSGNNTDVSLMSPVVNMSGQDSPEVTFDTYYQAPAGSGQTGDVDLSLDGGQTWSTVWQQTTSTVDAPVSVPIPQAAGQSDVQVRFRYIRTRGDQFWSIDNVFIGTQQCVLTRGGLVAGQVTDGNTGAALDGATVASAGVSSETTVSADSPQAGDGFYELFSAGTGGHQFTATDDWYSSQTETVPVAGNSVTRLDFALAAGKVTVSPKNLTASVTFGKSVTRKIKFTNHGTAPVQVSLSGQDNGFTQLATQATGSPLRRIVAKVTRIPVHSTGQRKNGRQAGPGDAEWTSIADYPIPIEDNAVASDPSTGDVYSIGGASGSPPYNNYTSASYVYSPVSQAWSPIASEPQTLQQPAAAFADGTLYLMGGLPMNGNLSTAVYAYDPAANTWSHVTSMPVAVYGAGVAVLDGQIYMVGGCTENAPGCATDTPAVQRYDPATDTWTRLADYPFVPVGGGAAGIAQEACAGIVDEVVCAGGSDTGDGTSQAYIYDTAANSWSLSTSMPQLIYNAGYAAANGEMQVMGGHGESFNQTSQAEQYDPTTDTWTALPSLPSAVASGGAACGSGGLYVIGGLGEEGGLFSSAEVLPGYTCGTVPWMSDSDSAFALAPGQSVTVSVTLNSSCLSQPGTYEADLEIAPGTPYPVPPVPVTLQAKPPVSWGELSGTVTDATTGKPVAGASVQICTRYDKATGSCGTGSQTYTLTTNASGGYQWWLPQADNPLQVVVSAHGYLPQAVVVKITKGAVTKLNFALQDDSG